MRCNDCNKFVGQEMEAEEESTDFEVEDVSKDGEAGKSEPGSVHVTATARLVAICAECSNELKETTFEMEGDLELPVAHSGDDHEIDVSFSDPEVTEQRVGKGRRAPTKYGVEVTAAVNCSCGQEIGVVELSDETWASAMDEI